MSAAIQTKPCEYCDKPFAAVRVAQRFCTDACRSAYHRQHPNPLERESEFSLTLANPNPSFKTRKDGDHYFVEFELQKDEWEYFVDPNVNRQGMVIESSCMVSHQSTKPVIEKPVEIKGGPLAQLAGQWCGSSRFWEWAEVSNENDARLFVVNKCGVLSRKELDHNESAARIFHNEIRTPFSNWLMGRR